MKCYKYNDELNLPEALAFAFATGVALLPRLLPGESVRVAKKKRTSLKSMILGNENTISKKKKKPVF